MLAILLSLFLLRFATAALELHIHPVSTNDFRTCAILDNREVVCWGRINFNDNAPYRGDSTGEMGDNLPRIDLGATQTDVPLTIVQGLQANCVLFSSQRVKCWGVGTTGASPEYGTLGYEDTQDRFETDPTRMGTNLPFLNLGTGVLVQQIAMEGHHVCALTTDGRVKCWGRNTDGQLGYEDTDHRGYAPGQMGDNLPFVDLGPGVTATRIACGGHHSCALLDSGNLKCWGMNTYGQLGYEDTITRGASPGTMGGNLTTVNLGSGRQAMDVDVTGFYTFNGGRFGYGHTCAVLTDGFLKCWGANQVGELGLEQTSALGIGGQANSMGDNLPTVPLFFEDRVLQVKVSNYLTCALLSNTKTVKCWGDGFGGALGQGDVSSRGGTANTMGTNLPSINLGSGITTQFINVGIHYVCALLETSGNVKCWGRNNQGQLGQEDTEDRGDEANEMGDQLDSIDFGVGRTVYNGPTPAPTPLPTGSPTPPTLPTLEPTPQPTDLPSVSPTTSAPTNSPTTRQPTRAPVPTPAPTQPDRTELYIGLGSGGFALVVISCVLCAYLSPTAI